MDDLLTTPLPSAPKKSLFFVVTQDWYFYSHRLPMVRAAQRAGFQVHVVTHVQNHRDAIESAGVIVHDFSFDRRSLNPLKALHSIRDLTSLYREKRPDLVHHIAMKPILYGSIAAFFARVPHVLNAFAGLGYVFTHKRGMAAVIRATLVPVFRLLLNRSNSWLLFQNPDDLRTLAAYQIGVSARTALIKGSGVDIDKYAYVRMIDGQPKFYVAFAGRMIKIKGLDTLKQSFKILQNSHPYITLLLCGEPDEGNPESLSTNDLQDWATAPNVEWLGHVDMASIWPKVHVAIQPSLGGEGVPKSLLEAAATGRPIIASDVAGCREIVKHGVNGALIDAGDAAAFAQMIAQFYDHFDHLAEMGIESRAYVEAEFSAAAVEEQTMELYNAILNDDAF
jgi:glycosyltransferase involved in cell wall biosynthesis